MISVSAYCENVFDGTHSTPEPCNEGFALLTSKNIVNGRLDKSDCYLISESDYHEINRRSQVHQWDILFSMIGTVGSVCLVTESDENIDFAIKNMGVFSCRNEKKARWLYYYLQSPYVKKLIQNYLNGAVQKFLPLGWLRGLDVPELTPEREADSNFLWNIDCLIENDRTVCFDLEAAAKLLYDYWFVQFDFPDENGKPYKSSGGKMVWNDKLKREIPAGWTCVQLGRIAEYVGDSISNNLLDSNSYISTDNMVSNRGGIVQSQFVPKIGSSTRFRPGDVLLSNIRPYFKKIWCADRIGGCCNDVLVLRPILRDYAMLCYWTMRSDSFFAYDMAGSKGSKMPRGDKNHILQYPVALPPKNEKIAADFDKIANLVEINVSRLRANDSQLVELRDFLLPLLMNGQVTIGDDDK